MQIPIDTYASSQAISLKVGETKTVSLPRDVTSKNSYAINCATDQSTCIDIVSFDKYSVSLRGTKEYKGTVYVYYDFFYEENGRRHSDTHTIMVDVYESGSGGGQSGTGDDTWETGYQDKGCWGTITVTKGSEKTIYANFPVVNEDKVKCYKWSSKGSPAFSITSKNWDKCVIKGEFTGIASSSSRLYCYMEYGTNSFQAYYDINVTAPKVTLVSNISLNKESVSLLTEETTQLTPTVSPSNATYKTVTWASDNIDVATVSSKGLVKAVEEGSATITCRATDGSGVIATCKITVKKPVPPIGIIISPSSMNINIGDTKTISYSLTPTDATTTVTWKSDNTSIATVSSSGLVKGIAEGKTTIRATTDNGKTSSCEVTVKKVEATSISLPSTKTVYIGETVTLTYTMTPSNAMSSVTWKSADTSIATVSSSGVVTGKKEGSTNITVTTDNGKSASCKVYVEPKPIDPTKITLYSCNVEVGYSTKIRYTLEPENATTTITWKSSDTSIATVSSDGIVKGIKQGSAKITATTANGLSASIWVYVGGFKVGTAFSGISSDDYDVTYKVIDINAKTCEVYSCNTNVKRVSIQSSVMGYKVVGIGKNSFENCKLSEVSIPGTVKYINQGAFNLCESLEKVDIAEGVETIGYIAFQSCDKLTSIYIPNSVKLIEQYAFHGNGLESISGMEGVEIIGEGAFKSTPLKSIHIPESVKEIGYQAFHYCNSLKTVTSLNKKPTAINDEAFGYRYYVITLYVPMGTKEIYQSTEGWKKFKNIEEMLDNPYVGMTFNAKTIEGVELTYKVTDVDNKECELIESPNDVKGKVTIPSDIYGYTLTRIGEYAFYIRGAITEVVIPNTIKYIGVCAFFDCKNMKGIIPVSVTEIGNVAFKGCTEITASDLSNLCVVGSMAFDGCEKIENIKLGSSLKEIEYGAFMSTGLKEIIIPKSVESIDKAILTGCNSLETIIVEEGNTKYDSRNNSNCIFEKSTNTVLAGCKNTTIPEETRIIGDGAFDRIKDLKTINLPEGIITIDEFAFYGSGLEEITLSPNAYLDECSFADCDNLKVIRVLSTTPKKIHENAFCFDNTVIYSNATLYVPFGTKSLYASADVWKNFKNIVEMEQEKIERITVSQFLSKADTKTKFELSGVVKNVANTVYGKFDLEQNGSKVYINGTLDKDGNAQKWGSLGVSEGDSIVLQGVYTTYNSAPAIKNAQYISHRRNMTVNLSKAGYATFYDSKNSFDLPKGLTAKVVTGVSDGKMEYRSLSDNVVPAGVAVMISDNANGGTYTLSQSLSEGRYSGSNLLYGSDETTTTKGDGYHYKLAYGHSGTSLSNVFGWYWGNDYGGAFKSEAHRAWMVVPKSSKTKSFSIEGETTEIVTIDSDDTEGACYDLQGRRVTKPAKNGLYIMNGKTIIVK